MGRRCGVPSARGEKQLRADAQVETTSSSSSSSSSGQPAFRSAKTLPSTLQLVLLAANLFQSISTHLSDWCQPTFLNINTISRHKPQTVARLSCKHTYQIVYQRTSGACGENFSCVQKLIFEHKNCRFLWRKIEWQVLPVEKKYKYNVCLQVHHHLVESIMFSVQPFFCLSWTSPISVIFSNLGCTQHLSWPFWGHPLVLGHIAYLAQVASHQYCPELGSKLGQEQKHIYHIYHIIYKGLKTILGF